MSPNTDYKHSARPGSNAAVQTSFDVKTAASSTQDLLSLVCTGTCTDDGVFRDLTALKSHECPRCGTKASSAEGRAGRYGGEIDEESEHFVASDEVRLARANKVKSSKLDGRRTAEQAVQTDEEDLVARFGESAAVFTGKHIGSTQSLLQELFGKLADVKAELAEKSGQLAQVEAALSELTQKLQLADGEKALLTADLRNAREQLESSRKETMDARGKLKERKKQLKQQFEQLEEEHKGQLLSVEKQKRVLATDLDAKQQKLAEKLEEIATLRQKVAEQKAELNSLRGLQEAYSAKLELAESHVDKSTEVSTDLSSDFSEASELLDSQLVRMPKLAKPTNYNEAIAMLKEMVRKLERSLRRERKLHQVSKEHIRCIEEENAELQKVLGSRKLDSSEVRESIDFRGKSRTDVINELIQQSAANAKKLLTSTDTS